MRQEAKEQLLVLQAKTKNGKIVKEESAVQKRSIHKLEHQVEMAKTKLSAARGDNQKLKKKIDELRRDKLMYTQILRDLVLF